MKYVFLALLTVVSIVHLIHSWQDDTKKRKYTKAFPLLFIIAYYFCSADDISWVLVAALITSWLGDVLLIPHGNGWFTAGGISFMATHILFILVYAVNVDFSAVLWPLVIPAALVYYGISAAIMRSLKPTTPKMMVFPMFFYLICNSTMNVFSLMQLTSVRSAATVIAYTGAVLFFISDCTLFLVRYHKNENLIFKRHFTVMLTYILGEFLITQGMIMLSRA
ncbi:MAG: lysoplasmalogenase [Clostridia bacterium]|nr:lysoplasmalogenase [Clostridia bacterium]